MRRRINARTVLAPTQRRSAENVMNRIQSLIDYMDRLPDRTFDQLDLGSLYEEALDTAHGISVLLDDDLFKED